MTGRSFQDWPFLPGVRPQVVLRLVQEVHRWLRQHHLWRLCDPGRIIFKGIFWFIFRGFSYDTKKFPLDVTRGFNSSRSALRFISVGFFSTALLASQIYSEQIKGEEGWSFSQNQDGWSVHFFTFSLFPDWPFLLPALWLAARPPGSCGQPRGRGGRRARARERGGARGEIWPTSGHFWGLMGTYGDFWGLREPWQKFSNVSWQM